MCLFLFVSQFRHFFLILCLLLLHALVHFGLLLLVEHFLMVGHFGIEEHLENHQFVIQVLQLIPEFRMFRFKFGHINSSPHMFRQSPVLFVLPRLLLTIHVFGGRKNVIISLFGPLEVRELSETVINA